MRQHILKGAVVVFVTAGYSGKRFIFEKARSLCLEVLVARNCQDFLIGENPILKYMHLCCQWINTRKCGHQTIQNNKIT